MVGRRAGPLRRGPGAERDPASVPAPPNDTIRPLADKARILQEACRLLGTHLRVNRVAYGEIEGDDCVVVHDYVDGVASLAGHLLWRNLAGSRTADILKGWTLSVNDTATESHTAEERAALKAADIRAYIVHC